MFHFILLQLSAWFIDEKEPCFLVATGMEQLSPFHLLKTIPGIASPVTQLSSNLPHPPFDSSQLCMLLSAQVTVPRAAYSGTRRSLVFKPCNKGLLCDGEEMRFMGPEPGQLAIQALACSHCLAQQRNLINISLKPLCSSVAADFQIGNVLKLWVTADVVF